MSDSPIYLDYAATTPVDPRVAEVMAQYLTRTGTFGNPASVQHAYGRLAHEAVEQARASVAALIAAQAAEIVFTSGATESNNLALKGVAQAYADRGRHIVSMKTEHKSVVDTLRFMEQQGWRVTWLTADSEGRVAPEQLAEALCEDSVLVSMMLVNNETGVLQDIAAMSEITRARGVLLHVDAAQALGKLMVDVNALGVDLLSISAHKFYGPKGIGALYVRRQPRVRLVEQMHGGGHERGMRSGTLAVHQIVGLGVACDIAAQDWAGEATRVRQLRDQLWAGLSRLPGVFLNGSVQHHVPGILNISVDGVDGEALHAGLSGLRLPLAVSSGSACTAASQEASYVLRALGRDDELAYASIRFSLGRWTSAEEIAQVVSTVSLLINNLRARSATWQAPTEAGGVELASRHSQYSDTVWEYFRRGLQSSSAATEGESLSVVCDTPGSRAVLELTVTHADGQVLAAGFRSYGCVSAIATGAWLCEWLQGRQLATAELPAGDIEQALQLSAIKRHCALLAEDALGMLRQKWSQRNTSARQAVS